MNKVYSLQFLRAFACLNVLFCHVLQISNVMPLGDYFISGGYGVDLFFILSGYLIFISTKDDGNWLAFSIKRFFRIFPLYWIAFSLFFIWEIVNSNKCYSSLFFIQNLLMFPWSEALSSKSLLVGVAWSTVYEVYFYFIFTLILFFNFKKKYIALVLILIFAILKIMNSLQLLGLSENSFFIYISSLAGRTHIIPFIIGILICMYKNNLFFDRIFSVNNILLRSFFLISHFFYFYFLLTPYKQINSYIISSIIFFLWINVDKLWTINYTSFLAKILIKIGDISYSIYLLHCLIITLLINILYVNQLLFLIIISFLFSVIFSLLTYKFIELPFMNLSKRIVAKSYISKRKIRD